MGLFDFVGDILGLSPPSTGEAMSKEDIAWLMDQALTANRTNKQGLFGGWDWNQGADGTWTQTESINPALMPGIERLLGSATQAPEEYKNPFGALAESMLAERHSRRGMEAPQMPQNATFSAPGPVPFQQAGNPAQQQPGPPMMPPGGGSGGGGGRPPHPGGGAPLFPDYRPNLNQLLGNI